MIESICHKCGLKKVFDDDKAGKKFKCPTCETIVLIEKIDVNSSMEKEVKLDVDTESYMSSEKQSHIRNNIIGMVTFVIFSIVSFALEWTVFAFICLGIMLLLVFNYFYVKKTEK